jgi:TonB family protein
MLASLAIHSVALGVLLFFAPGEPVSSALVIDLPELESATDERGPKAERAGSARPIRRAATVSRASSSPPASPVGARALVEAAPLGVSAPAPSSPEPPPPPERDVAPSTPESRPPEPAAELPREEAPGDVARSAPSAPAAEVGANPGGASADQTSRAGFVRGATPGPPAMAGGSPAGAGVALAPVGPPGGGPGSEYGAYYSQIRQRIQETLEYPPAARRQGIKGTVLLELLIKPDGAISAVVKVSSSHRLLDDAALETVRNLPRQPFPAGLVPRQLKVPLPVVFDLK